MEVTKLQLPFILLMMSRLHFPVRFITEPFKWFNNSIQSFPSSKRKSRPNSKQLKSLLIFKHQNTFTFLICIYQRRTTLTLMWFLPLIKRDWIWMLLPGWLGTAGEQWRFHPTELNPINNQYQTLLSPALFCSQLRRIFLLGLNWACQLGKCNKTTCWQFANFIYPRLSKDCWMCA